MSDVSDIAMVRTSPFCGCDFFCKDSYVKRIDEEGHLTFDGEMTRPAVRVVSGCFQA